MQIIFKSWAVDLPQSLCVSVIPLSRLSLLFLQNALLLHHSLSICPFLSFLPLSSPFNFPHLFSSWDTIAILRHKTFDSSFIAPFITWFIVSDLERREGSTWCFQGFSQWHESYLFICFPSFRSCLHHYACAQEHIFHTWLQLETGPAETVSQVDNVCLVSYAHVDTCELCCSSSFVLSSLSSQQKWTAPLQLWFIRRFCFLLVYISI